MKHKISSQKFYNFQTMSQSAVNWDIHCAYQLTPDALTGEHYTIELPTMQLSYSHRLGGFMHRAISPADSISVGVVLECEGIATFDRIKLSKGDIVFFDDKRAYSFVSKGKIEVAIISILNTKAEHLQLKLYAAVGHYMKDSNNILATTLKECRSNSINSNLQTTEDLIVSLLTNLLDTQTPKIAKLTKSEKIVLDILNQMYGHMDGKVSIESLAKQYSISEHALQNSFKSLFGFTPKRFLRLLKLNHVHYDLKDADPASSSVSRIAQKWGFIHMGRFSHYYTDLFGENPSVTLQMIKIRDKSLTNKCAGRQEEM